MLLLFIIGAFNKLAVRSWRINGVYYINATDSQTMETPDKLL